MPHSSALAPFRLAPWTLVLGASALVAGLAALPPFVAPPVRAGLMQGFHFVCHQLPTRSFAVEGVALALCHRCTGVVLGVGVGVLLVPALGRRRAGFVAWERPALFATLVLLASDWLLGVTGVWANTPASRFGTGLLVGLAAVYLIARAVAAPEWREAAVGVQPVVGPA